jgi:hypothetical protein
MSFRPFSALTTVGSIASTGVSSTVNNFVSNYASSFGHSVSGAGGNQALSLASLGGSTSTTPFSRGIDQLGAELEARNAEANALYPGSGRTLASGFPVVPGPQSAFNQNPPKVSAYGSYGTGGATEPAASLGSVFERSSTDGDGAMTKRINPKDLMSASDERLNTIRARSARTLYNTKGKDTYTSDRGPITTMRLLKGPGYDPLKAVEGATTNVDADVNALVSEGGFVNFFVTDMQVDYNEKTQIMTTFGDGEVVYYFGRQPVIMNIRGLLFDSIENDWFAKFLTLYAGVLRGTQLAKSFSLIRLTFPSMVVTGSISNLSVQHNSHRDTDILFSMQFVAKEVVPMPASIDTSGGMRPNIGSLVDFKANRAGVQGYSLSMGTLGGGFMNSATKTVGDISSSLGSLTGGLTNATSALNAFRTNIFTPVFGVISSLTKIVRSVTGDITKIITSFTNPVNAILSDITSIATQASGLALLVENSINDIITIPARMITNANNTVSALKGTAGTISRIPENISETFRRLYGSGRVKQGAAILSSGKKRTKSKAAILTSGTPYTPYRSNRL